MVRRLDWDRVRRDKLATRHLERRQAPVSAAALIQFHEQRRAFHQRLLERLPSDTRALVCDPSAPFDKTKEVVMKATEFGPQRVSTFIRAVRLDLQTGFTG
jgi:hypothetical protein